MADGKDPAASEPEARGVWLHPSWLADGKQIFITPVPGNVFLLKRAVYFEQKRRLQGCFLGELEIFDGETRLADMEEVPLSGVLQVHGPKRIASGPLPVGKREQSDTPAESARPRKHRVLSSAQFATRFRDAVADMTQEMIEQITTSAEEFRVGAAAWIQPNIESPAGGRGGSRALRKQEEEDARLQADNRLKGMALGKLTVEHDEQTRELNEMTQALSSLRRRIRDYLRVLLPDQDVDHKSDEEVTELFDSLVSIRLRTSADAQPSATRP